jgi:hypothetical protein
MNLRRGEKRSNKTRLEFMPICSGGLGTAGNGIALLQTDAITILVC